MVTFVIKGLPKVKQRPRFASRSGKVITYTPKTTASFENLVKLKAENKFKRPLDGAIGLAIRFYLPRPQRMIWKTRPMPEVCCDKRPDIDNLAKAIIDGLNGIAFKDDGQIADLHITKKYHAGDGEPKTVIMVNHVKEHVAQSQLTQS